MTSDPSKRSTARRIGQAALIVSGGILLSRVLGFVREMVFAAILGANAHSDEYFVAFIIPDFMNYLLAGGYLSITFVPILSRYLVNQDEKGASEAFSAIVRPVALAITVLVIGGMITAEPIIRALEPGFTPEQVVRATRLTRIVLPAQIFFVVGSLFMAAQYVRERFLIPTLAPILYNVGIIAGGVLLGAWGGLEVEGFAWGVLAGAFFGNFLVQWLGARKTGLRWAPQVPWFHPALKDYIRLAIPLMLAQSVVVLDEQLGRTFGSLSEEGSISWINYARRVMLVPVGVLAQAAGVAAYPFLARMAADNKLDQLSETITRALRYVLFLSLPALIGLALLAEPLIRILFQRGQFSATDTLATGAALAIYALSIPFWGIEQVVARGFYARRQMWTPVVVGTLITVAAIPVYYSLVRSMGHTGLALASTLAVMTYSFVLGIIWFQRMGWKYIRPIGITLCWSLVPAGAGAYAALLTRQTLMGKLDLTTFQGNALTVAGSLIVLGIVWLGLSIALKVPELADLRKRQ